MPHCPHCKKRIEFLVHGPYDKRKHRTDRLDQLLAYKNNLKKKEGKVSVVE